MERTLFGVGLKGIQEKHGFSGPPLFAHAHNMMLGCFWWIRGFRKGSPEWLSTHCGGLWPFVPFTGFPLRKRYQPECETSRDISH